MPTLRYAVYVIGEDGEPAWFTPGQTVPEWAAAQITNPHAWDTSETGATFPAPEPERPTQKWTKAQIRDWATVHDVDLGEAVTKADMLAAIG